MSDHTDDPAWPPLSYWLIFAVMGAVLVLAALVSGPESGSHAAATAEMVTWVLSQFVTGTCAAVGALCMIFRRTRLFGIAALSAGAGGFATSIAYLFLR